MVRLKDWETTARTSGGRNYLLWQWLSASDKDRAKMPEPFQLKMTTFLDGDEEDQKKLYHAYKGEPTQEWSTADMKKWKQSTSEWSKAPLPGLSAVLATSSNLCKS